MSTGLPNWIFRDYAILLCDPVCAIFNASVQQGNYPSVWNMADVIPIPKVHPPISVQSDLHPILLTPTISKQLEAIVGEWILTHVHDQLDKHQYGSLKGRSTTHALIDVFHYWNEAQDNGKSVRALFVDYAKAFDHIAHSTVLNRLHNYGVLVFITKWLVSFLHKRQQRVKIGDVLSDWVTLHGGMPQGSWLGSLIFLIRIDDLWLQLLTHKYVDDATVSAVVEKEELSQMQSIVDELVNWSTSNHMNVSSRKEKK